MNDGKRMEANYLKYLSGCYSMDGQKRLAVSSIDLDLDLVSVCSPVVLSIKTLHVSDQITD